MKTSQVIDARAQSFATLEDVEAIMAESARAVIPVTGDCLEGAGIEDGGWVAVDFTRFPAPPRYRNKGGDGSMDLCLCYATFPGGNRAPTVMCKVYIGVWGTQQIVGTRYRYEQGKHRMNVAMEAERIFGAIYAAWGRDGRLLWERDPAKFPEKLGTAPTICGGNCVAPLRVS